MGRGNGRPVFKEYCRPCRVKNPDRAEARLRGLQGHNKFYGAKRSDQRPRIFPYGGVLYGTQDVVAPFHGGLPPPGLTMRGGHPPLGK